MGSRVESALYSGASGMFAHGTAIAITSDNLANANTTGFRTSRVEFASLLPEGVSGGSSDTVRDAGSGVRVSDVRTMHQAGTIEQTGRALDAGIDGSGFFAVGDATSPSFTRAGNFFVNGDGELVTADGLTVLGFTSDDSTTLEAINLGGVSLSATATSSAALSGNVSATSAITTVPANPQTFNAIAAAASSTANFEVFDSLGTKHSIYLGYFKTATNTWTVQAYIDGADVGGTEGVPTSLGSATLNFDGTGVIPEASQAAASMTLTAAYSGGAATGTFTVDVSDFTQFGTPFSLSNITQNGKATGDISGFTIESDGGIIASLDNGEQVTIGTIGLATFENVDGLKRGSGGIFLESELTGDRTVGRPGDEGFGALRGSSLERSTVDLATEFTNLIQYQRGYQANSKIVQTADRMIEQAVGMMR